MTARRTPLQRGWMRLAAALLAGWLACAGPTVARAADEAELKAAIVYKLLMFVDWPADAQPPMTQSLVLCLPPDSRYADALRVLAEQPVRGLQLQLKPAPQGDVGGVCHALLVEDGGTPQPLARRVRNASVLVIADGADVSAEGVVINLQRSDRKVLFELNLASARRARLQISSKLMRLASTVIE